MGTGQDTSEVRDGHQFDTTKLDAYLTEKIQGFQAPLKVRQFKVGQSNPTFLIIDAKDQKYVVRKKPSGQLLATAHMIEREFKIMSALKSVNFPVPKVFLLCEDNSVIGTPFYVMEFLQGRIFTDVALKDLKASERKACYEEAAKVLARLHSLNYSKIGLEGYGKPSGFYKRQIERMGQTSKAQVIPGKVESLPYLEDLLKYFSENLPEDSSTIVHGDYKLDNIIFHPTESRIIGVLDWEMSTIGHPFSDLANLCLPYHYPEGVPPPMEALGNLPKDHGIPTESNLHQIYCQGRGINFPIKKWEFYVAFAFFRAAVILQGIGFRSARGQASNPLAELIGSFGGVLAESAWSKILEAKNSSKL